MRLCECGRQKMVVVAVLACLATALLLYSYTFTLAGRGDTGPLAQAGVDPIMARSTALRQHVRDACRALKFPENEQLSKVTLRHLIYDDAHQAVYCYIPKVACTSWKRVFLKLTGQLPPEQSINSLKRSEVHSKRFPLLADVKNPEEKLKTYKKFMFVRPPFERVLAAYRDKFEGDNDLWDFHKHVGIKIEKKYRGTTAAGGHNITFPEFLRFISEPGRGTEEQRNEHWLAMHEVCSPCSLDYDFIGRKENLAEDGDYVLQWLGVTELVGKFPAATRPVNASHHVSRYRQQLEGAEVLSFYAKFLPDYLLFDYASPGEYYWR